MFCHGTPFTNESKAYYWEAPTNDDLGAMNTSDNDNSRSPSPSSVIQYKPLAMAYSGPSLDPNGESGAPAFGQPPLIHKPDTANPQRLLLKTRMDHHPQSSSPAPPGSGHPILYSVTANGINSRRQRPETSHQKAVNMNRKMRVDHILHKQIMEEHYMARQMKRKKNSTFGLMVMKRLKELPDMYDTEDERSWGPGGLIPHPCEVEDFGEEALAYKKAIDRATRRLYREENAEALAGVAKGDRKRKRKSRGYPEDEGHSQKRRKYAGSHNIGGGRSRDEDQREEGLDDLDLDLLGEGREDDQDDEFDEDSGLDDSQVDDGDLTEEEVMNAT